MSERTRGRVVVLDHTAQEGGAEIAMLRLVEVLRHEHGLDVQVLLLAPGPLEERLRAAGIPVSVLEVGRGLTAASRERVAQSVLRSAMQTLGVARRLARALGESGCDLVVANSLKSAVFAFIAAPLARRRWIWHLHDRLARDYLPAALLVGMRAIAVLGPRAIVANSSATRGMLPSAAKRKTVVAFPGLPPAAFTVTDGPRVPEIVGIVGRVSPTKGQREFLDAVAQLAPGRPDLRFAVVGGALFGEDDYEAEMRAHAERLGIADRVEFSGWVGDPGVRLRGLTLLVHASPVPEPFGQVVVEAMAAGVPVVATAAGGVLEILDPAGRDVPTASWRATPTGILVAAGDARALAAGIGEALDDPAARMVRAEAARLDAEARFTIDRTARTVLGAWGRQATIAPARGMYPDREPLSQPNPERP